MKPNKNNPKKVSNRENKPENLLSERLQQLEQAAAKAPEELKVEVFVTLDAFQLAADLIDLFTSKFIETNAQFLENLDEDNTKESS